ncbi:hypothetical protein VPH35_039561 [Triticum aestivum]|uniref:uncharacterized protein n=1 Tax=Triticum aestivum TaxID=4565 RepID=UPI001D00336C|nr:uncharacterized protein LOC123054434 [Triticum aestivum]
MDHKLMLGEYCADLSDMHKTRHYYRATSLSEEEKLYLHQIDDFATATIAEYEASVGPVPAFDNHLSLFSQEILLEFPEPLAPPPASSSSASASASHHEPAVDNGGDVAC